MLFEIVLIVHPTNLSCVQNAPAHVLHHGLMLGTAGAAFAFVRRSSKILRGVDDAWNTVAGCVAAGAMGGIFCTPSVSISIVLSHRINFLICLFCYQPIT